MADTIESLKQKNIALQKQLDSVERAYLKASAELEKCEKLAKQAKPSEPVKPNTKPVDNEEVARLRAALEMCRDVVPLHIGDKVRAALAGKKP